MEECIDQLFKFSFKSECVKLIISKILSLGIITLSMTLKLPQIKNMLTSKDVKGLSYISMYTEIFVFNFAFIYGYHYQYPFSTYGENLTILVQNLIILLLAWKYDPTPISKRVIVNRIILILGYISFQVVTMKDLILPEMAWKLIGSSSIPLISLSRISQIISSFMEKSTGPLSVFTFVLNILGGLSRIFTNIQETGDLILIFSGIYSVALNVIILIQIICYGGKGSKTKEK